MGDESGDSVHNAEIEVGGGILLADRKKFGRREAGALSRKPSVEGSAFFFEVFR